MKWSGYVFAFLLLLLTVYDRNTIEKQADELVAAQEKITQLTKANSLEIKPSPVHFVKRDKSRSMIFSFLYEINKDKKRIKYLPGELLIEDLGVSQDDQFLDLLDFLYEQELLVKIELPANESIQDDMKTAGFSPEYLSKSKDGLWRIKIKQ